MTVHRYEYRVVGFDKANGEDVTKDTFEHRDGITTLREARAAKAEMKREAAGVNLPYDDLWIERRVIPEWGRVA